MRLKWNSDFATGKEDIDRQNQWFFDIFNELAEAAETDPRNPRVEQIVAELEEYAHHQFRYEENILKNLPEEIFMEHVAAHKDFQEIIKKLYNEIYDDGEISSLYQIILFLSEWIFNHVKYSDKYHLLNSG